MNGCITKSFSFLARRAKRYHVPYYESFQEGIFERGSYFRRRYLYSKVRRFEELSSSKVSAASNQMIELALG